MNSTLPSVRAIGLSKAYRVAPRRRNIATQLLRRAEQPKKNVFSNLNLSIEPGEKVLLVGSNGSGKTTLLKLLAGLMRADEGSIEIGGQPVARFDRRRLGLMLSLEMLYGSLSGYENLEYSGHLYRSPRIAEAIDVTARFWKLEPYLDHPVESYSYGMRARLCVARATLHEPDLLLMDEPTVCLDKDGVELLVNYLAIRSATALIATHQPEVLSHVATRIIDVSDLVAVGGQA